MKVFIGQSGQILTIYHSTEQKHVKIALHLRILVTDISSRHIAKYVKNKKFSTSQASFWSAGETEYETQFDKDQRSTFKIYCL